MNEYEEYFEITETENLIDNVEMVAQFLDLPIRYRWKWASIALHQALYGAMICALQGTDHRQTVVDRSKESGKMVMLHVNKVPIEIIAESFGRSEQETREMIASPFLIGFYIALNRVQKVENLPSFSNVQALKLTAEEKDAIDTLTKEFRNEFEHFSPKAWVVFSSGFPDIFRNILRVIGFLALESKCVRMSASQEQRFKITLAKVQSLLQPQSPNE